MSKCSPSPPPRLANDLADAWALFALFWGAVSVIFCTIVAIHALICGN